MKSAKALRVVAMLALGTLVAGGAVWSCTAAPRPDGGEGLLEQGKPAPALTGLDQDGKTRAVADHRGSYLLVYFYPKDGTPGCTTEACAFRDVWGRYEKERVALFGVSADDVASHKEFAEEHAIPFPLIADPDNRWSTAFGVGTFLGMTERVSFLVSPESRIVAVYPDVDPGVHADQVLKDVARLRAE
ncbi:MAG: peroxiredoxin [Myxococcota bacterium]